MMTDTRDTTDSSDTDAVLDVYNGEYCYLGEDGEGYHHHYHEAENTIYVTTERYERYTPEHTGLYYIRVTGEVDHIEDLDKYDDRDLTVWLDYIDETRNWESLEVMMLSECLKPIQQYLNRSQ